VWFRAVSDNLGFIYHDNRLARSDDGKVRARDIYITVTGTCLSDSLRPLILEALANQSRGFVERLTGEQSLYAQHMAEISRMLALQESNPQEALQLYRELPPQIQTMRIMLIFRLKCAQAVSSVESCAAVAALQQHCGQDGSVDAILLDYYVNQKHWADARICIDNLNKMVGGDSHLDSVRISLMIREGKLAVARAESDRLLEEYPNLTAAYNAALEVAAAQGDFDRIVELFTFLEMLGVELSDPTTLPIYAEFIKSPQYAQWMGQQESDVEVAEYETWPRMTQ
jgi:hypothetical protein